MERLLLFAHLDQLLEAAKNLRFDRSGVCQFLAYPVIIQLSPVDRAVVTGQIDLLIAVGRRQQAVNIDGRNAFQRQHDRHRCHEPVDLIFVGPVQRALHRFKIGNIHLIWFFDAARAAPHRDPATKSLDGGEHLVDFTLRQGAFGRPQPDPVMAGSEIEIGASGQGRRIAPRQPFQIKRIAGQQRVRQQRRQGEIIDDMRFILVAEIGQIFMVGNIGFGDDDQRFDMMIKQGAQQPYDFVSLIEIDRRRADFFPEKGDRIKPEDTYTMVDIGSDDLDKFDQDFGIAEIEVQLVGTECAPDITVT